MNKFEQQMNKKNEKRNAHSVLSEPITIPATEKVETVEEVRDEIFSLPEQKSDQSKSFSGINMESLKAKAKIVEKQKSPQFKDTHRQKTFWIHNDLLKALEVISINKGDQTNHINKALVKYLNDYANE
ncbi:hypothetical protein COJ46_22040 [Bacillus sp. AFS077874]|uniref:hypothetical protein n=1 Tax=Bacillus sp. AFS077874 TaxID=2033513 RepID=UPI000BF52D79|nr:hypothetical protein [Bacillus sp. AFS077874]PFM75236.1 hypothetical protein COJ46_22040 [Bacillus sp. AFS077874]